ncbi:uncharacterized protein EI97DRAFT_182686 [Westerdykella ornata]|uniref:SH3 domain-containing protein n=1 Tax=Westerdykella ornata TaxID=318751 RepID=A0A6A6JV68_WESOR|nr:uncharacterized protein EI97DRAFT_182686 [Westerdykella ornata]KAF2279636.1 hypothetical protein EI97DRAFT_182686 [Westerdykella ornata]
MYSMESSLAPPRARRNRRRQSPSRFANPSLALPVVALLAASLLPSTMAQQCIPLKGSTLCPAFSDASVSTSAPFPFLAFVSDVQSFDRGLREYISTGYARRQYQERMGCSNVKLSNTTELYARYTTSVLCNLIVQASVGPCNLTPEVSRALCAPDCGDYAISEQQITSSPELCGTPGTNALDIIRADYQDCSTPSRALTGTCVAASSNEPEECGYQSNLPALCAFCGQSSANSTDSCCVNAKVEERCKGVRLPWTSSMPPLSLPTGTVDPTATATPGAGAGGRGLSGGAIAGIVVGSVVGALLILAGVIFFCISLKRRRGHGVSSLNMPSPTRKGPQMGYRDVSAPPEVLPGARVARMSALEGSESSEGHPSPGMLGAYHRGREDQYASPASRGAGLPRRDGSLSGSSILGGSEEHSSPRTNTNSDRNFSSPEGVASGQSEQLQFFKDYYSQDDIHPNDAVAVLWAYQPRANDEFQLERGDMLKVVGIWDDGWATGVKLTETAEQWEARKQVQRDSGVSGQTLQAQTESDNEIKAFPLVCVCLPQHWRKTIEGDSTTEAAQGSEPPPSP